MADMGIAINVGGVAGIGLLDEADEILVQDQTRGAVIVTMTTLTVRTSDFPSAAVDAAVVIGTNNFTVRERLRQGDGGLTKLVLGSGPVVPPGGPGPQNILDGGTF